MYSFGGVFMAVAINNFAITFEFGITLKLHFVIKPGFMTACVLIRSVLFLIKWAFSLIASS